MTFPFDAPRYNWTEQKIGNTAGHNIKGWTYQVYKVKDNLNNNTYAVKVGELKQVTPDSVKGRLNALSPVFSPVIIPNLSYYIDPLYVYIVTPFCPRGNLENYISQLYQSKNKPTVAEVKGFMLNIIDGLDFIHGYPKKYQVHGNIKPSNIFFSTNDINNQTIAIGDIFHSQVFTDTFPIGNCSSIELLESNDCTTSTDIWSLGCVLYYICTGQYPFPKKVTVDYIKGGNHGGLLKVGEFECFNGLYENMLSVDKKKRYPTKKIRDILNSIMNDVSQVSKLSQSPKKVANSLPQPSPPSPQYQKSLSASLLTSTPPVKRKAKDIGKGNNDDDEIILLKKKNPKVVNPTTTVTPASYSFAAPPSSLLNIFNAIAEEVNNNLNPPTISKLFKFVFDNYSAARPLFNHYSGQPVFVLLKVIDGEGSLKFKNNESLPSDTIMNKIFASLTLNNVAPIIHSICINGSYNYSIDLSTFQTCLSRLSNVTILRLNYVGLDDNSTIFFENLPRLPNLRIIDISHNRLTDVGITSFMSGIINATGLTELNVGFNSIKLTGGNLIGSSLLKYPYIQILDITSCNIGVNGFKSIINGLTNDGSRTSYLVSLSAENNNFGDQGLAYLGTYLHLLPNIQRLLIANNRKASPSGTNNLLMKKLEICRFLSFLTLSNNKINDLEMIDLCKSLYNLKELMYLDLGYSELNSNHIMNLSIALKNLTKLTYLNLGNNNFDRSGLQSLCINTFPYLPVLDSLHLDHADLKGPGIDDICQCINNGFLQELTEINLASCKIKSEALKKLLVTFKKLTKLETLDLSENQFDEKQIQIIQNNIMNLQSLRTLCIKDGNNVKLDSNLLRAFKAIVSKSNPSLKVTM